MRYLTKTLALIAVSAAIVAACSGSATSIDPTRPPYPMATPASSPASSPAPTQGGTGAQATPAPSHASSGTAVHLGATGLGRVLVDAKGLTLYLWAHDTTSKSTCSGDCAQYWPPLTTGGAPVAGTGVNGSLLGTTKRADGAMQVTYAGHPLYHFVQDAKPGDTNGEGLTGFGGRWDPVSSAGGPVQKMAAMGDTASYRSVPSIDARVIFPRPGARAGRNGTFSVDLELRARSTSSNDQLAGYRPGFIDPSSPQFHPGPDRFAPGLVVLLSTTPTVAGTPLQGPNTNLAGVFQINDVQVLNGRKQTFNSWLVGVPGFFGRNTTARLTVFAVAGTAPALLDGSERPISNVVTETFTIAR